MKPGERSPEARRLAGTGNSSEIDYGSRARAYLDALEAPGWPLEPDLPPEEYALRVARSRERMTLADLDALVVTSSSVGRWFTSLREPHEWHDICPARVALYVLTHDRDVLFMTPTAGGEHFATTRRLTHVSEIRAIVERSPTPRHELWGIEQLPIWLRDLGVSRGRIGFELGDCMTLGLSVHDFLRLQELMPEARFVDAAPVIRWLMGVLTPWEVECLRRACAAGSWIHRQVPQILRPGMAEQEFCHALAERFGGAFEAPYEYEAGDMWDVRNGRLPHTSNPFHAVPTRRPFLVGDVVMRAYSGVSYRGYVADIDRVWAVGRPTRAVLDLYRLTWECNRAMAEAIRPGVTCADVYAAGAAVEARFGRPPRPAGRTGHGLRNTSGLSIHPDNPTVLEPWMVVSVEPMFVTPDGFFDLEDQYLVTPTGREPLHELAPEELPWIP